MFSRALSLSASNHNTLPGSATTMRIQAANISAVNLWLLLKLQKTKASSGRP